MSPLDNSSMLSGIRINFYVGLTESYMRCMKLPAADLASAFPSPGLQLPKTKKIAGMNSDDLITTGTSVHNDNA